METDNWLKVQSLFLSAADLLAGDQTRFLDSACGHDREIRAEVEALLKSDHKSGASISAAVADEAEALFDGQALVGGRLGAYRVVKEIGRGGMGAVYLATRDDDRYRKRVAIKVVKRGMDTAEVLGRFRHERQILANLDHPYIARLLDAGTTPDGRPFLVMDYVEGLPLDAYCGQRGLDIKSRCRLFLRICDAVSYAHRNLVVHRDLKPSNIFVTDDGTPKLLDFGIAKLLSADAGLGLTLTALARPFTPEYASPEQARGLAMTTATDVYSLGAILYELLTGHRAQSITSTSVAEIERAICETEPPRPSRTVPGLDADLDNIVLMAMRKEPERRYPSVDQLAEDLRRHLEGRPVLARQSSLPYRVRKFVRRNRSGVAAAGLVFISLVAGIVMTLSQSRQAEAARAVAESQRAEADRERSLAVAESRRAEAARQAETQQRQIADQQRNEALRERASAEERLNELLNMAHRTLFDVHDAIANLPGAVEARREIVTTTLDYLKGLEKDHLADDRMRLALSAAYAKIAAIQGDPYRPSLGDFKGSRESYRKAEAFLAPMYARKIDDPDVMIRWIDIEGGLAELAARSNQRNEAAEAFQKLVPVAHRLAQLRPSEKQVLMQEPDIEHRLAITLQMIPERELEHANREVTLLTDLVARFPDDPDLKRNLGSGLATAAHAIKQAGDFTKAAGYFERSIRMREELLQLTPGSVGLRRDLIVAYGNYAALLGIPWSPNLGRFAEARTYCKKSVELARDLVKADPKDMTARYDLANALSRLGMVEPGPGEAEESLQALQEAIGSFEPIARENQKSSTIVPQLALARQFAGLRLENLGQTAAAEREYRESLRIIEMAMNNPLDPTGVVQVLADEEALAHLLAAVGGRAEAVERANRSVALAEKYAAADPKSESRLGHVAEAYFALAALTRTRAPLIRAITIWHSIRNPAVAALHKTAIGEAEAMMREIEVR